MKKNRKYLKPYIRRAKPKDFSAKKATNFRLIFEMGFYQNKIYKVKKVEMTKDKKWQIIDVEGHKFYNVNDEISHELSRLLNRKD